VTNLVTSSKVRASIPHDVLRSSSRSGCVDAPKIKANRLDAPQQNRPIGYRIRAIGASPLPAARAEPAQSAPASGCWYRGGTLRCAAPGGPILRNPLYPMLHTHHPKLWPMTTFHIVKFCPLSIFHIVKRARNSLISLHFLLSPRDQDEFRMGF
jgi:hypothetical protein